MCSTNERWPVMDFAGIAQEHNLRALAVIGSRARGNFTQYSDLDLIGLSDEAGFRRFSENGLLVELHVAHDVSDWAPKPSWWYALDELQVKIDDGTLSTLPALIVQWRRQYCPSLDDVKRNRDWLEAVVRKLRGSASELSTAFIISTSMWEILAGAFIARDLPVPASSDMLRLAPGIVGEGRFETLITGTVDDRRSIALDICNEIIEAHNKRVQATQCPARR